MDIISKKDRDLAIIREQQASVDLLVGKVEAALNEQWEQKREVTCDCSYFNHIVVMYVIDLYSEKGYTAEFRDRMDSQYIRLS